MPRDRPTTVQQRVLLQLLVEDVRAEWPGFTAAETWLHDLAPDEDPGPSPIRA